MYASREASIIGRKGSVHGSFVCDLRDSKEIPDYHGWQGIPNGDFRSGYYRSGRYAGYRRTTSGNTLPGWRPTRMWKQTLPPPVV